MCLPGNEITVGPVNDGNGNGFQARSCVLLGLVVRSMVSDNHWLSSIKINGLSWYLTLVSANQASKNSALYVMVQSQRWFKSIRSSVPP